MTDLLVRNTADVMHTEKNVAKNIFRTLFGEKDGAKVRLDLQNRNIRWHLWLRRVGEQDARAYMPDASYVLSKADQEVFLTTLKPLKLPTHYRGTLHSKILKGKLFGLESHDFHVLMQDIMLVCLRNIGDGSLTKAIIRLSQTVNMNEREALFEETAETLCLLEKEMPPFFFDVMVHLIIHLVEELFIFGPVHVMDVPFREVLQGSERLCTELSKTGGLHGKRIPSGGGVWLCFRVSSSSFRCVEESEEDLIMNDTVLEGKGKDRYLDETTLSDIHGFGLDNLDVVEDSRRRYDQLVQEQTSARAAWRARHGARRGSRAPNFPTELAEHPAGCGRNCH